jgi:hypothetical protein
VSRQDLLHALRLPRHVRWGRDGKILVRDEDRWLPLLQPDSALLARALIEGPSVLAQAVGLAYADVGAKRRQAARIARRERLVKRHGEVLVSADDALAAGIPQATIDWWRTRYRFDGTAKLSRLLAPVETGTVEVALVAACVYAVRRHLRTQRQEIRRRSQLSEALHRVRPAAHSGWFYE